MARFFRKCKLTFSLCAPSEGPSLTVPHVKQRAFASQFAAFDRMVNNHLEFYLNSVASFPVFV